MTYEAIKLSWSGRGENPNRKGFKTEGDAWDYVFSTMCDKCKKECEKEMADPSYNGFVPCMAEWYVGKEE